MTSDDVTPDTGTLTRRELRARTRRTGLPWRSGISSAGSPANSAVPQEPVADAADSTETVADAAAIEDTVSDAGAADTAVVEVLATQPPGSDAAASDDAGIGDTASAPPEDPHDALGLSSDIDDDDEGDADSDVEAIEDPPAQWADAERPATAFTWIDADRVEEASLPAELAATVVRETGPDLLADAQLRPPLLRARWLAPLGTLAALVVAYSATMLVWPLHAIAPTVAPTEITATPSVAAAPTWPTAGSAGVSVVGFPGASSTDSAASIASVTKVVSSMMVLDALPLQPGEQGPEFSFTSSDSAEYWEYRIANQSALDVPVGGVLTEYQLLQGTLLGSANNYIDRLAREIWGSDAQFAEAARHWLADRGLSEITVVTPSGFDEANVATPEALLRLAHIAMQNPVFAEIVGTKSVELPGAGLVENSNGMLQDEGVVGIKTGTLVGWCLLTAKDVTIDGTNVRLYAAVLNQGSDDERLAVTRALFAEAEAALASAAPAVTAGTVVGEVTTVWGIDVDVVVEDDATVLLWNGATADTTVQFELNDQRTDGDDIGTLSVTGPVNATTVEVSLAENIDGPSPWWRLTHPLELLGITTAD